MALQIPLGSTVSLVTSFGSVDCTTDSSFSTFLVTDTIGFSCSTSGSVKTCSTCSSSFLIVLSTSLSTFFSPLSSFSPVLNIGTFSRNTLLSTGSFTGDICSNFCFSPLVDTGVLFSSDLIFVFSVTEFWSEFKLLVFSIVRLFETPSFLLDTDFITIGSLVGNAINIELLLLGVFGANDFSSDFKDCIVVSSLEY